MKQFPDTAKFIYPWRAYQQRVLDELETHLGDEHLHVVAPPGSGKTVLGLEVARRLNKPTLILAPTISIRNQWVQRFCELFLQQSFLEEGQKPDWISVSLKAPAFLTVSTYQALHGICSRGAEGPEQSELEQANEAEGGASDSRHVKTLIAALKAQGVATIVVDEAHHLKNSWWRSLSKVKKALKPVIVGLTATPPYDVSPQEWERYVELNGPVDAEISVPELVVNGDLCPHQDYVLLSFPTQREGEQLERYRHKIAKLCETLAADPILAQALEQHPIFQEPLEHLDWIYGNLEYYSATLIYLKAAGREISPLHLEVLGDKRLAIPKLDEEWLEIAVHFFLSGDGPAFVAHEEHREILRTKLKRAGVLDHSRPRLTHNKKAQRHLTSSISKLQSIRQIVAFEEAQLGGDLRLVVITDFIRKDMLLDAPNADLNKIGVVPIFEMLRRDKTPERKLAVLTGSLVILPRSAWSEFQQLIRELGFDLESPPLLAFDDNFVTLNNTDALSQHIVYVVTCLFERGCITVLIGTKALLGEGWDAPAINALILASFVGSYVSSNQMRGRAIRSLRDNQEKTANIWHLVCVDLLGGGRGEDLEVLERRFKTFVGVSYRGDLHISNGTHRIGLPTQISQREVVGLINDRMFEKAQRRSALIDDWKQALKGGTYLSEEIAIPFDEARSYSATKQLHLRRTLAYLVASMISGAATFLMSFGEPLFELLLRARDARVAALIVAGGGALVCGTTLTVALRSLYLYVRYRDIAKDVAHIGEALLRSLHRFEFIKTPLKNISVQAEADLSGCVACSLRGATTFDNSLFIEELRQIVGTIDSPRYLIVRKSRLLGLVQQRDYHPVPETLGRKKEMAEYFSQQWRQRVGDCDLIHTRNLEGRKLLLRARWQALAARFEDRTEVINRWK